jgi:hypothetical protein
MGRRVFFVTVAIAIVALLSFNFFLSKNKSQNAESQSAIAPVFASQLTKVDSPDGKLTLQMKTTKGRDGTTYSFSVSGKEIFAKTVDSSISFSIPYNTWSPNDKYVFLKETGFVGSKFFALSVDSDSSLQDDQTANITDLFAKKYPDLKIEDVTGWGGVNLIVFNTSGPSFWFEMPGKAIIQLSTLF